MRGLAFVASVAVVVLLFIAVYYATRTETPPAALASPSATPTASATATLTPAASTAVPSPTPSPTPTGLYVNQTYKFSVVLPTPYRRSATLSFDNNTTGHPAAQDAFTARTTADESVLAAQRCETACEIWNYVAFVAIYTDAAGQTPRQWFDAGGAGHAVGETVEDVTIDGRPGIKIANGSRYPVQYIVADRGRMCLMAYDIHSQQPIPPGATKDKLEAILTSFKLTP